MDVITSMYAKQILNVEFGINRDLVLRQVYEKKRIKKAKEIFFELKEINKSLNYSNRKLILLQNIAQMQFDSTYGIGGHTTMYGLGVMKDE